MLAAVAAASVAAATAHEYPKHNVGISDGLKYNKLRALECVGNNNTLALDAPSPLTTRHTHTHH